MGESHPTGERVVGYLKDGHRNLAVRALQESVNGLRELIEMDADDGDDLSEVASDEVKSEDQQDLDKYEMLLNAIKES